MPDLASIWFLLVGVLLVGYAVLDGFDLGAGTLHLFVAHDDAERRTVMRAIGPVWDGNEVWLLTAGGGALCRLPAVYATVFSGFYLALMLLLVALIFRAVSLEFRSKLETAGWRRAWDVAFSVASFLPALLFGVAIGNVLRGRAARCGGGLSRRARRPAQPVRADRGTPRQLDVRHAGRDLALAQDRGPGARPEPAGGAARLAGVRGPVAGRDGVLARRRAGTSGPTTTIPSRGSPPWRS